MKNKFSKGIKYRALMIIVVLVMLLLPISSVFADSFCDPSHHSGDYPRDVDIGGTIYKLYKYGSGWGEDGLKGTSFSESGLTPVHVCIKAGDNSYGLPPDYEITINHCDTDYTIPVYKAEFSDNSVQVYENWLVEEGEKYYDLNGNGTVEKDCGDILLGSDVKDISHILIYYLECPLPECSITGDTEICDGETTELCANEIAGATYSWTGPGAFESTARCIIVGVEGTYSVTIENECGTSTCDEYLIVNPNPACNIESVDPICAGESVQLEATVNGGTPPYSYSWSDNTADGGTFSPSNSANPTWTPPPGFTGTAILTLTVTDDKGCESECTVDVTVNPNPACNIVCDPENCRACEDGEVTLTENGGAEASRQWYKDGFKLTGKTGTSITVTASGTYSVTVTDKYGCQSTCEKKVTIYEEPACNIVCDPEDCIGCENGGVTLTENGGDAVKWLWSTGEKTKSITVTASGTYSVTITDEFGCQSICEKKVTVYPNPECIIASVSPICAGESVQLTAAVNGGTSPYSYSWDDGGVGGTFSPSNSVEDPTWTPAAGFTGTATLTLTVKDSKGCTTTCFVNVTVDPCEECKCSLIVLKRDEAGNPIENAVFEVDGIEKTTTGGDARWDNLECDTTYEVRELSPIEQTEGIHLGDCGERSTMRVVNKVEEEEIEVLALILPAAGPDLNFTVPLALSGLVTLRILLGIRRKRDRMK